MIKPWRILLLLALIYLCLFGFMLIFPEGKMQIGGVTIEFVPLKKLFDFKDENAVNTTAHKIIQKGIKDTQDLFITNDTTKTDTTSLEDALRFQFPDNNPTALHRFFADLDSLEKDPSKKIRIFHFGDSQIEGDRITSTLRELFQRSFGGSGVGLIGMTEVNESRSSISIKGAEGWKKYAIYGDLFKRNGTKKYGPLGGLFRYKPKIDSATGWFMPPYSEFKKSKAAYAHAKKMEYFSLYYNGSSERIKGKIILSKKEIPFELDTIKGFREQVFSIQDSTSLLKVELEFKKNLPYPDFYGCSFDDNKGIQIDNIPMRGSSGTDFHRMDFSFYTQIMQKLRVKFIILEFGVNVVPYIINDYSFYEKSYTKTIQRFKNQYPDAEVLVVGVSDVAIKQGTDYVSSPNIEKIRDAQRNAAHKSGCAFWDLYAAMGGKNSMVQWVNANPTLAEKDYTHFNHRGARVIGEMLHKSIMYEYQSYKKKRVQ